jgi:outer membrane protein insertion porin family
VDIRFVNNKGEAVDKDGNPIQGRLSREFITRELKLKPGDVLTQEVIQADLQQLQQLGLFEWANVTVTPTDDGVDVVYNVQERRARSTDFGGGYNDDVGVYGTFGYQDFTLLPNPQRVEGNAQISLKNIDFNAQFVSPYQVAGDNLGYSFRVFRKRTTSNIFNRDIDLSNGQRLRDRRFGATAALTRPIGEWWGTAGLNFTRISTRDANGNIFREDVQGNPLTFSGKGIDDLYTVSFAVTRDWRDNPFQPTRGAILSLSTEQSIPIGVGNILQNRLVGNYIQYIPVRWFSTDEQNAKRYAFPEMFAVNVQAGTVIGDMPPTQAFMLGGVNSVRGYEEGNLGSARSYFLASGEYRFPVVSRVGGVIFADFASDLGSGGSVPGKPAVVRNKPGIGFGTGVGARWRSPFGILRVDVGVNDQGEVRFYTEFGTGDRF